MIYNWAEVEGAYFRLACHPLLPKLAASTKTAVEIYSDSAERLGEIQAPEGSVFSADTCLAWHPTKPMLAISGGVSNDLFLLAYIEENPEETAVNKFDQHRSCINVLIWNSLGNRLLSIDKSGDAFIWRADGKGLLFEVQNLKLHASIDHAACIRHATNTSSQSSVFLVTTEQGKVLFLNDIDSHPVEAVDLKGSVRFSIVGENTLLALTEDFNIFLYNIIDQNLVLDRQAKLSINNASKETVRIVGIGVGTVALTTGGSSIRICDLVNEQNEELSMPDSEGIRITSISFNYKKMLIVGGTDSGHLLFWKMTIAHDDDEDAMRRLFTYLPKLSVGGSVEDLFWGIYLNEYLLDQYPRILSESSTAIHMLSNVAVLQTSQNTISVAMRKLSSQLTTEVTCPISIKGLYVNPPRLAVWSGKRAAIYELDLETTRLTSEFDSDSIVLAVDDRSVYSVSKSGILDIYNFEGVIKQSIALEAKMTIENRLDMTGSKNFLALFTSNGELSLIDITRREAKSVFIAKQLLQEKDTIGNLLDARVNVNGTCVALVASDGKEDDRTTRMCYLDVEKDSFVVLEELSGYEPQDLRWDEEDPRLLIVFATTQRFGKIQRTYLILLFSSEHGLKFHGENIIEGDEVKLINCAAPYLFVKKKAIAEGDSWLVPQIIRDFDDIDIFDRASVKSLLDVLSYLTSNNIDQAFKALKQIKGKSVWESMAKICVKNGRVDAALACFGKMGRVYVNMLARQLPESDSNGKLALLAIHLNMPELAESIYLTHRRYKDLANMKQSLGLHDEAIELIAKNDRIHLKTVYYNRAKAYEEENQFEKAAEYYEKSGCASFEVPRMYLENNLDIVSYIETSNDESLKKWMGQYAESQGHFETAMEYYDMVNDSLSKVRILCSMGNVDEAINIAKDGSNPAACFFLARRFEAEGNYEKALQWYSSSKCFTHATRLAKEKQMDLELMHLATLGNNILAVDVARYFEEKNMLDKAANLYFKAGNIGKAMKLCLDTEQYHLLDVIASEVKTGSDPVALTKAGEYFLQVNDASKALKLFMKAGNLDRALQVCLEKSIIIDDEIAEGMVSEQSKDSEALNKVAQACMDQGSYQLACKKFTQGGDRSNGMLALLKSGDVKQITFYANVSGAKNREIYIMAAHFLQAQNYRDNPDILKTITTFYTKAKAFDSLISFYFSFIETEIDEYSDYERAMILLKDTEKILTRLQDNTNLPVVQRRVKLIDKFVRARKIATIDIAETNRLCRDLLQEQDLDTFVRVGDVYACLVDSYLAHQDFQKAESIFKEMLKTLPNGNVKYYLDETVIRTLTERSGLMMAGNDTTQQRANDEIEEIID